MRQVARRRGWGAGLLALVLTLGAPGAQAVAADDTTSDPDGSTAPSGVVRVGEVEVPVLGTYAARATGRADHDLVRGAVHGVQRIEGATVLYVSMGYAVGGRDDSFNSGWFFDVLAGHYPSRAMGQMALVDREGLTLYRPLKAGDTLFTTDRLAVIQPAGELRVVWAVFPELPGSVDTVDVVLGDRHVQVPRVPVADGALEPVVEDPVPLVGAGWPELPDAATIATADPAESIFDLFRRTGSAGGEVQTTESVEDVFTTLDANVLFDFGSADLTSAAQEVLARVGADIAARGTGEVVVTGHTDSDGSNSLNQDLSERRAASVVAALQPASGDSVTFVAQGRGEREPVAPNDSPENKQLNRRVTVEYQVTEGES